MEDRPLMHQDENFKCRSCGAYEHPIGTHNERHTLKCPEVGNGPWATLRRKLRMRIKEHDDR